MALHRLRTLLLALLFLTPFAALAQNQAPPAAAPSEQLLKPEELEALVAPIALYPDSLLSQVLIASTYPLEVVQADRWTKENKTLKGDGLKAAVDKQAWDESIKSLVATQSVLTMMSAKLDWTQKLGDAVLAQQPDVMDAIQRLRTKADNSKKLTSTKEQKVTKRQEQGKQVIVIEPTDPDTVYVPYYDPAVAYGGWPYPAYPPYSYYPPGYVAGGILATGLAFGAGYALGRWGSGGNNWGGSVNWNNNNININRGGNNWQHNASHRQGVRYNNQGVQQRFGNNNLRNGSQGRTDFRGRGGDQVLRPGGGGQGNLGGGANRPGAGAGSGQRPGAGSGQRPGAGGGGKRPSAGQRPAGGGGRGGGNALGNMSSGRAANLQSARGNASLGSGGRGGGGGGMRAGGGGGGMRAGGGGGRGGGGGGGGRGGGGGGGRRSDIALKHDIVLLGHLDSGIGFYRFSYNGSERAYVGVMAQDVQMVAPEAVTRGRDGYLRVFYDKLGVKFQTYQQWIASGARVPAAVPVSH
jgi:hypothetical protein